MSLVELKSLIFAQIGIDIILDFIGAPYFNNNLKVLNKYGTLVLISYMGGTNVKELDLRTLHGKCLEIKGTTLRSRPHEYRVRLANELGSFLLPLLQEKKINPCIDKIFSLNEVQKAHEFVEKNLNKGKVILRID